MNFERVKGVTWRITRNEIKAGSFLGPLHTLLFASGVNLQLATGSSRTYIPPMFDTIVAELTTAAGKLSHLRRFL